MKKIGKDIKASEYWREVGADYAEDINSDYHSDRFSMVQSLIADKLSPGTAVLDFGCGEGEFLELLIGRGANATGIDPDEGLIQRAERRLNMRQTPASFIHGGVGALKQIAPASIDLLSCLNVAAYFTDEEDQTFYQEVARIVRPGGHLVITHSNELFDLYTLNAFTLEFMVVNFVGEQNRTRLSKLLTFPDKPNRLSYNIRENPLSYGHKLKKYGFAEEAYRYSNFHGVPPLLMENPESHSRKHPSVASRIGGEDQWKLMFQCSTFGARARRL